MFNSFIGMNGWYFIETNKKNIISLIMLIAIQNFDK